MNSNELTFNEIPQSGFLPNDWGQIDITTYTDYSDDKEVCFKLVVWSLQRKFALLVSDYFVHLELGILKPCSESGLQKYKLGLEVLNRYNPRDIIEDTTEYNVITYSTILKIVHVLYNKY